MKDTVDRISSNVLAESLHKVDIKASKLQLQQWKAYLELLARWNRTFNLTAIEDVEVMVSKHLLDSLSIAHFINGQRIIDVGSGGGLPGIPLAIAFPQKTFTLIDAVAKKTRFLRQVIAELGLANVQVVHTRVEDYRPEYRFDLIISRAFSSMQEFILLTDHLRAEDGEWLAMKGKLPVEELAALDNKMAYTVHPLAIPGLDAERHLIQITQTQ